MKPQSGVTVSGARRLPQLTLDRVLVSRNDPSGKVGRTVNGALRLPPLGLADVVSPRKSPVWLVVKLRYPTGVSAGTVAEHAHQLVAAMKLIDPDLGLEYDPARSSEDAERRSVTVALSPRQFPPDLDERLNKLLAKGQTVEPRVPIVGVSKEWDNPVAV